ncbi:MAG TPA: type II toxin-antitoxin system death-on-curing family toxin [Polyangia bacterium]|nr:type II toxin-antitoxin system death-on-curing family toxin [Polyangia bacterium]
MTDPAFLTIDDVLALHADRIEKYGGSLGLRDAGGLSSALGMASATFGGAFLHPTLAEMAAAYLFHISQAHAFVDGNKRVALAAALAFLWLNDRELHADPDVLYDICIRVAAGEASKADAAVFIERHLSAISDP